MSFSPFAEKYAKAILKKACKGKSAATFRKTFQAVLDANMGSPSYDLGGVSLQLGEECLALAEVLAAGRGIGKVELPVIADDWLNTGIELDDDLAKLALEAVDKVRTKSASWSIAQEIGGWPAWTGFCRGLSTRLKKPAKNRKVTPKAEGLDAVIKRLKSKQCQIEMEKGHAVELRCFDEGELTDDDLPDIVKLKKLRLLYLTKQSITDKGLGQLSALKQLRDLSIDQCDIKGKGFKDLDLPKLRELSFARTGANTALANCQHLTSLRKISLRMSDVSDTGLQKLAFATSLVTLNIDQCKKIKGRGLKVLASLPKLRQLHAMQIQISPAGFDALCESTALKVLDLLAAKLPARKLDQLSTLKRLEELNLFRIDGMKGEHLGFLKELKKLDLSRNKEVADETVKILANHPNLEELSFWECSITQETADLFLSMKTLRDLSVAQTNYSRAAEKLLMKTVENR